MSAKLTELDLQLALDETDAIRFRTHGEWLAGLVKRLNAVLENRCECKRQGPSKLVVLPPVKKLTVVTGSTASETNCIS